MSTSRLATAAPWSPSRLRRERSAWSTAVSGVVSVMAHSLVFVVLPRCATAPGAMAPADLLQEIQTVSLAEVDATPRQVDVPDDAREARWPDGSPRSATDRSDGAADATSAHAREARMGSSTTAAARDGSADPAGDRAAPSDRGPAGGDPARDVHQGMDPGDGRRAQATADGDERRAQATTAGDDGRALATAAGSALDPTRARPTADRHADRPSSKDPRDRADRPTPDEYKRYVHTDGANAPAAGLGDMISAHNAVDPTRRAADASSTLGSSQQAPEGRPTPRTPGTARAVVEPATQRGDTPDVVGTAAGTPLPRVEPRDAPQLASVPARPDTPARPATGGSAARDGASATRPTAATAAARAASGGADPLPAGPQGWAPTAFRLAPSAPAVASQPSRLARSARDASVASLRADATDAVARLDPPTAAPPTLQAAAAAPPAPVQAPALSAIDSLRASLGWGRKDDDRTVAPQASTGTVGAVASTLGGTALVLPDDVAVTDGAPGVSAVATALGRYVGEIEALVIDRWNTMPVPAELVAMGARGTVVVELRIDRAGRVTDTRIVQRSGYPLLDMQARNAIPTHFPRFPRELEQDELVERVTMRTRNATPPRTAP